MAGSNRGHNGGGRWFNIGDRVQWSSQSLGRTRTKSGTIIAVIPPDELPSRFIPTEYRSRHKSWTPYVTRGHESYVVVGAGVDRRKGEGGGLTQTVLYWPRVGTLEPLTININGGE